LKKTNTPKIPLLVEKQKAVARLKHSGKTIPDWLPDRKTNTENGNKGK